MNLLKYLFLAAMLFSFMSCNYNKKSSDGSESAENNWIYLLDKDLSQWEIFLGVPHKSTGIKGYEDAEDITVGTPLGLTNIRNVFSTIVEDDEVVLKVTGEIFGSLMSKKEYENYHLKLKVKWGDQKWEPRLNNLKNNGLLYHGIGEPGKGLWNTWMSSLELEIENTNFGDFIAINDDNVKAKCPSVKKGDKYYFDPNAPLQDFSWRRFETGRCLKSNDREKPMGEWTTIELVCYNDMAIHIVEGEVVMTVHEPRFFNGNEWIPMNKGKLQLQSEGAETYFKNVQIKSINKLEEKFQKYIK